MYGLEWSLEHQRRHLYRLPYIEPQRKCFSGVRLHYYLAHCNDFFEKSFNLKTFHAENRGFRHLCLVGNASMFSNSGHKNSLILDKRIALLQPKKLLHVVDR